jgi:hypothetical protein
MAVIFHKNVRNGYLNCGFANAILYNFTFSDPLDSPTNVRTTCISFWGGAQPTAADFAANYMATYDASMLLHLNTFSWVQANGDVTDIGTAIANSGVPATQTPYNSGTITWAVLWPVNALTPIGIDMPLSYPRYAILPVSNTSGTGIVRFVNTTVATSTPATLADFSLLAAGGIA